MLVNRTPHFSKRTRSEANRGLDLLESQLGRNQVSVAEAVRGMELLNRAHSSLAFGLLREPGFVERFGAALRQLGLRGIEQRLDEVPGSVMAQPIPGPTNGRQHRDELPAEAAGRRRGPAASAAARLLLSRGPGQRRQQRRLGRG